MAAEQEPFTREDDGVETIRLGPAIQGTATHYGFSYHGRGMGCGGVYRTDDPTIVASAARAQETRFTPEDVLEREMPQTLEELICSYSWPCDQALRVARCESTMNPRAVSPGGHMGLFQLSPQFHQHRAGGGSLLDPAVNTAAAHSLYVDSGRSWRAWSCRP